MLEPNFSAVYLGLNNGVRAKLQLGIFRVQYFRYERLDTEETYLYMFRIRRVVHLIWIQVARMKNQAIERKEKIAYIQKLDLY